MADRFGIYVASFVHAGGTLNLQQLESQNIAAGSSYKSIRPGGSIDNAAHILSTANPRARFTTGDIYTVLNAMGGNFHLACSGGHAMRYQKRLAGGAFMTGNDHFVQTTPKGLLHVTSIDVDIDSNDGARMELEYIPLSVAGENPITDTPSQSLAAVAVPAYVSQFFMGGVWANAVAALGLTRMRVLPGLRIVSRRSDSGVFARYDGTSLEARDPMFEMTFLNAALPATIGSFFMNVLPGNLDGYLQRGTTAADGRIATATTSHIRFRGAAGSWGSDDITVANEDDATTTIRAMTTGAIAPTLNVALGA